MPSSATQVSSAAEYIPETPMSFNEFYNDYGRKKWGDDNWMNADPDWWLTKFANVFTGDVSTAKSLYEKYINDINLRNEQKAVQSSRAYDEYMSNTAYSRAFADLEKMGVNPYLLLNSGSTPATSVGSSSKPDYSVSHKDAKSDSNVRGRDVAFVVLAILKLISML